MINNNYKLPDGNVLISFSGGRTSAFMLYKILEANNGLNENVKVVFANTGREMPETYDFVQRCCDEWGVTVTWLEYKTVKEEEKNRRRATFEIVNHNSASRNGEPFEMLIKQNRGIPDPRNRFCTAELKVKTFKRYLKSIGWKKWVNTIGIRADEPNRIKESNERFYDNWYPIAEANHTKHDILDFWKRQTFDLKVTSGFGNCDGCFLKSEKSIATLWKLHPERAEWWMSFEEMKHGKKGNKRTFHKNRTYKEIGDFVEKQGDWIFDTHGILCQADGGECTG